MRVPICFKSVPLILLYPGFDHRCINPNKVININKPNGMYKIINITLVILMFCCVFKCPLNEHMVE